MDGFFVAKFKVEKRKKQQSSTLAEEEAPQMRLDEDGELVEEKKSGFNDDEDKDIIDGKSPSTAACALGTIRLRDEDLKTDLGAEGKRKHLLKTKGIKVSKGKGAKHNLE